MSFESQLKETFMKHADDVRPDTQSWPVIEKRVVRRHRAGMFATAASVAALIAVTAIVTPRLVARKPSGFSKHGKPQPAVTEPAPVQRGPIAVHVGADQGFQISIPTGWRAGWWEGVYEYEPAGLPSLAKGGDTFAVSVKLVAGPYDRSGISGAKDPTEMTTINDHLALASEYVGSDHTHDAVYQIQWASCLPPSIECSSNFQNNTLVVIVRASTEALWTKYWPDAQNAVRSIDAYDGTHPAHLEPPTNTFGNSDSLTALMTRFLDARVERVNAEAFMSPQAQFPPGLLPVRRQFTKCAMSCPSRFPSPFRSPGNAHVPPIVVDVSETAPVCVCELNTVLRQPVSAFNTCSAPTRSRNFTSCVSHGRPQSR